MICFNGLDRVPSTFIELGWLGSTEHSPLLFLSFSHVALDDTFVDDKRPGLDNTLSGKREPMMCVACESGRFGRVCFPWLFGESSRLSRELWLSFSNSTLGGDITEFHADISWEKATPHGSIWGDDMIN